MLQIYLTLPANHALQAPGSRVPGTSDRECLESCARPHRIQRPASRSWRKPRPAQKCRIVRKKNALPDSFGWLRMAADRFGGSEANLSLLNLCKRFLLRFGDKW